MDFLVSLLGAAIATRLIDGQARWERTPPPQEPSRTSASSDAYRLACRASGLARPTLSCADPGPGPGDQEGTGAVTPSLHDFAGSLGWIGAASGEALDDTGCRAESCYN